MPEPLSSNLNAAHSRRHFIKTAGLATLAGGLLTQRLASAADAKPQPGMVGSQLYGWGQYYDRMGKKLDENIDEVLSALRDAGYDYAESSMDSSHPDNNGQFADRLRKKGLKPVSLYTGGRLHEQGTTDKTVEQLLAAARVCKQAGFSIINCNPDPIGREKTDEELATQVNALTKLGKGLNEIGLKLGIHHHTPEMRNKAREFHYNFHHSEPNVVGFCFDVHWVYRGGVNPMEALRDYSDRVVSWHLRQSRGGIWWEDLDQGDVDYQAVSKFSREHHLPPFYTVELALEPGTKITRSVVENHKLSRDYVRAIFKV